jgi:PPM family protein phosphatase
MPLYLQSFAQTDVGLYRQNNEDAFLVVEGLGLYVLADGMGGHASGEVASQLATEATQRFLTEALSTGQVARDPELLARSLEVANEVVFREAGKNEAYRGMGTTIVALLRDADHILVAHVGDSRCYRLRQGRLEQLTEDHSLRNFYIKEYGYTAEEAAQAADSNVILRAVGLRESTVVDVSRHPLEPEDRFLLCSDGLSDYVDEAQILGILAEVRSLEEACAALISLANSAGGFDNTTVLLVQVKGEA